VKVLVVQEFWAGGVERHRAGEVMDVSVEFFELYRPFLKELKPRKTVEK
jgi:hypothetical protein